MWLGSDGSNLHKLTDTFSKSESGPVFSPDGTEIVFSQLDPQAANSDLWLMDPNGTIIPAHGYARGQRVLARLATRVMPDLYGWPPQTFVGLR